VGAGEAVIVNVGGMTVFITRVVVEHELNNQNNRINTGESLNNLDFMFAIPFVHSKTLTSNLRATSPLPLSWSRYASLLDRRRRGERRGKFTICAAYFLFRFLPLLLQVFYSTCRESLVQYARLLL